MDEKLRNQREMLELAERSAGIGIWDMDMRTGLVRGTAQFFQNLGLPPTREAVPIERLRAMRHPDDRAAVVENFRKAIESGLDHYETEYRIVRPDGEVRWILGRGKVVRDKSGKAVRYSGVDIDITDRKNAEAKLHATEERYHALVENASDLVFTLDLDFRITSANPAVKRHFGYTPEELIGMPLSNFVPAEQLGKHREMLRRKLVEGARETRYEMEVVGKTGERRTLETSSTLFFDRRGRPAGIHAIARDITDRKKYEEHLALTTRELSHRTKNILAVVQALVSQIGRRASSFAEFEERLTGCVAALARSHDLLTESDWQGVEIGKLIASHLVPFGLDETRVSARGPAITLAPQSAQLIGLALHELATNAAKYGALRAPSGTIAVDWHFVGARGPVRLTWAEQGGPPIEQPTRRGFGSVVLERMAASLGGGAILEFHPEGVRWSVDVDQSYIAPPSHAVVPADLIADPPG
jgi:PAS domain S-box-containing protein